MQLVLGSRNKKKLKEMLELLGDLGLEVSDLSSYPNAPEVEETADSFAGNAALKATTLAPVLGTWVLGEDSGLVVPALGGAPGVYSARYAGRQGDDAANNAKLLEEMAHISGDERAAYYVSTAVLADPSGTVVATVEGRVTASLSGRHAGAVDSGTTRSFSCPNTAKPSANFRPRSSSR